MLSELETFVAETKRFTTELRANSFNTRTNKYREIIQVLTVLTSQRYQCVYMALRLYTEIQKYRQLYKPRTNLMCKTRTDGPILTD